MIHRHDDSLVWADLQKVKHVYLQGRQVNCLNGENTLFWIDPWISSEPLSISAPILYCLEQQKISVADARNCDFQLTFRRWLTEDLRSSWQKIQNKSRAFILCDEKDIIKWKWGKLDNFSVRSVYEALTRHDTGCIFKAIWKANIPNKIKIFLWLMENNAVLTKDNMIRRKWRGDPKCYFCEMNKNVDHLFFSCPIARVVWAVVAQVLGATDIPSSLKQNWKWIPNARKFYALGIAAIF